MALREAIVFRERIIRTQQMLLNSENVADALQEIDMDEVDKLNLDEEEDKEIPSEDSVSYENITEYHYKEDQNDSRTLEHLNQVTDELEVDEQLTQHVHDTETETVPEQPSDADQPNSTSNVERYAGKPSSKLYATVNFAINARNTPRINWSKLSEDEIVELKRERRKRDCICELCGRHFTCPSNFKVHLLRHTGVKNFGCKQCPLKFYTPHLLRRHMLAHLCDKPYPCQYCGQTFADHSGRIQHERK